MPQQKNPILEELNPSCIERNKLDVAATRGTNIKSANFTL